MKQCPKCNREYSDRTLEFCLEDGARLTALNPTKTSIETVVLQNPAFQPLDSNPLSPAGDSNLEPQKNK